MAKRKYRPYYCQHCEKSGVKKVAARPKRLCWLCYYNPDINKQYELTSIYANRGPNPGYKQSSAPPSSTQALPGSEEKILVMEERLSKGFGLHHSGDLKQKIVTSKGRERFNVNAIGPDYLRDFEAASRGVVFPVTAQLMQER